MKTQFNFTEEELIDFGKTTVWNKQRMQEQDPERYEALKAASDKKFNINTDPNAAADISDQDALRNVRSQLA